MVPGQTDRAGLEELGSLVSHHVLDSPDCPLLRRLLLVSEQGVGSLHVGRDVGVAGGLVDGGHEAGGVEGWPVQHDGVAIPLRPHHAACDDCECSRGRTSGGVLLGSQTGGLVIWRGGLTYSIASQTTISNK